MPRSNAYVNRNVKKWFWKNYKIGSPIEILDVGPGMGTYYYQLHSAGYILDAVEIWGPYVDTYNLKSIYRNVWISDITVFWPKQSYDVILFGDILEHLTVDSAKYTLHRLKDYTKRFVIVVPWNYNQGTVCGNKYETHHQNDLDVDVMATRYPYAKLAWKNIRAGIYTINPNDI